MTEATLEKDDDFPEVECMTQEQTVPVELRRVVVLHHDDADGWAAAAIAINTLSGKGIQIYPRAVQYGQPLPSVEWKKTDHVYILDFSYERDVLDDLHSKVEFLLVLDHHEAAEEKLKGAPYAFFDLTKSGVLLAWEHFVPQYPMSQTVRLLDCYDLWKKNEPEAPWGDVVGFHMAVHPYIGEYGFWFNLMNHYEVPQDLLSTGKALWDEFLQTVEGVKNDANTMHTTINFKGQKIRTCFFHYDKAISLMSDQLYSDPESPVDATFCLFKRPLSEESEQSQWFVSARSPNADVVNVNTVAKLFGGGGHRLASGFQLGTEGDYDEMVARVVDTLEAFSG